jgi:hypothetical protein
MMSEGGLEWNERKEEKMEQQKLEVGPFPTALSDYSAPIIHSSVGAKACRQRSVSKHTLA